MDPIQILRGAYDYFDEQVQDFNLEQIAGVSAFMSSPQRGIKYVLGEMRLGLLSIITFNFVIFYYLRNNTVMYLKKSFFSTLLLYWLFFVNLLGLIPKIITYRKFNKLKIDREKTVLRRQMMNIFGKRIYRVTTTFSGISIMSHLLCIFVSFKYFFRLEVLKVDVDYHLGVYSLIFLVRLLYSYYRYRKYFYFQKDSLNKWDLQEHIFDEKAKDSIKKFKELDRCSICWVDYKHGDKLAEFTCDAGHIFHLECLSTWLDQNMTCPLCRVNIYDCYHPRRQRWNSPNQNHHLNQFRNRHR